MKSLVLYTILPPVGGSSTIALSVAAHYRRVGIPVLVVVRSFGVDTICQKTLDKLIFLGCRIEIIGGRGCVSNLIGIVKSGYRISFWSNSIFISIGMKFGGFLIQFFLASRRSLFYVIQHDSRLFPVSNLGPLVFFYDYVGVISPESLAVINNLYAEIKYKAFWLPQFTSLDVTGSFFEKKCDKIKNVAFVGNFIESKGVEYLLDIWRSNDDVPVLHFVGDGRLRQSVVSASLEIPGRVNWCGSYTADTRDAFLLKFYNNIDLLIVPCMAEGEGIPTVIIEALALGIPVLCTNLGGLKAFQGLLKAAAPYPVLSVSIAEMSFILSNQLSSAASVFADAYLCRAYYERWFSDQAVVRRWQFLFDEASIY